MSLDIYIMPLAVTTVEIGLTMKVVSPKPFLIQILSWHQRFPDSEIAGKFTLSETFGYYINFGLAPYLKRSLCVISRDHLSTPFCFMKVWTRSCRWNKWTFTIDICVMVTTKLKLIILIQNFFIVIIRGSIKGLS